MPYNTDKHLDNLGERLKKSIIRTIFPHLRKVSSSIANSDSV